MQTTETQPAAKRGFKAPCLMCGQDGVRVYLSDVTLFQCQECDAEFGPAEAQAILGQWAAVLAWVEQAPVSMEE